MSAAWIQRHRLQLAVVALGLVASVFGCWAYLKSVGPLPGELRTYTWFRGRTLSQPTSEGLEFFGDVGSQWIAVATVALGAWAAARRMGWRSGVLVVAAAGVVVLTSVLKASFGPTPLSYERLGTPPGGFGNFPSGHAAYAASVFGVLGWLGYQRRQPEIVAVMAFLVVAMGPARVAAGAHFVSDVLAGYAVGFAWLLGVLVIAAPWAARR